MITGEGGHFVGREAIGIVPAAHVHEFKGDSGSEIQRGAFHHAAIAERHADEAGGSVEGAAEDRTRSASGRLPEVHRIDVHVGGAVAVVAEFDREIGTIGVPRDVAAVGERLTDGVGTDRIDAAGGFTHLAAGPGDRRFTGVDPACDAVTLVGASGLHAIGFADLPAGFTEATGPGGSTASRTFAPDRKQNAEIGTGDHAVPVEILRTTTALAPGGEQRTEVGTVHVAVPVEVTDARGGLGADDRDPGPRQIAFPRTLGTGEEPAVTRLSGHPSERDIRELPGRIAAHQGRDPLEGHQRRFPASTIDQFEDQDVVRSESGDGERRRVVGTLWTGGEEVITGERLDLVRTDTIGVVPTTDVGELERHPATEIEQRTLDRAAVRQGHRDEVA